MAGGRIERLVDSRNVTSSLTLKLPLFQSHVNKNVIETESVLLFTAFISSIIVPFPGGSTEPYFTNNTGFQGDCPDKCPN